MKRWYGLLFCVLALAFSFTPETSSAQSISIDSVGGLYRNDTVLAGQPVTWFLRYNNNTATNFSISNGYKIYSPDGATWSYVKGDTIGLTRATFELGLAINYFPKSDTIPGGSYTGPDTIGVIGAKLFAAGLAAGYNARAVTMTAYFDNNSAAGKHICIDSAFFPPGGTWKWAASGGVNAFPAWNGPQCFYIWDSTQQQAQLEVQPDSIGFVATEGGSNPASQAFAVTDGFGGNIPYTASEAIDFVTLTDPTGTTPGLVTVNCDISGKTPGTYTGTISVASAQASNSPRTVKVTLVVNPQPKILVLTPDTLNFTAVQMGADPAPQTFTITEQNGSLIAYTSTTAATWISTTNPDGTTPGVDTVKIKVAGLNPGTYTDSITVTSAQASNSPRQLIVNFTVTAAPKELVVMPDTLFFTATEYGSDPAPQSFNVSELTGSSIAFNATKSASWLTLTNASGTTPQDVGVSVSVAGVIAGKNLDIVYVNSASASNSPQPVVVVFDVAAAPPVLTVLPDTLRFTASVGGSVPLPESLFVHELHGRQVQYNVGVDVPWVDLSKTTGTTPDSLAVSIIDTSLAEGLYTGTITFGTMPPNQSVTVPVLLNVVTCPTMVISKQTYDVTTYPLQRVVISDSLSLTSTGPGEIGWFIPTLFPEDSFTVFKMSGTTPSIIPFLFTWTHPDTGLFTHSFMILDTTSHCGDTGLIVSVNVHVIPKPCQHIILSDTLLSFTATEGDTIGTPAEVQFDVLSSDSTKNFYFTASRDSAYWLSLTNGVDVGPSVTATAPGFIGAIVHPAGLAPGDYYSFCTISSEDTTVCDPKVREFVVYLRVNKLIVPSTDTIAVATVPAVPGMAVNVPISFVSSCPIESMFVQVYLDYPTFVPIESVSFAGSRVDYLSNKGYGIISGEFDGVNIFAKTNFGDSAIQPGKGLLANIQFVIPPTFTGNFVQLTAYATFHRNCGQGTEPEFPEPINGGIVVDTATDYICGWVVDTAGVEIPGASVQLWSSFPTNGPLDSTSSTEIGSFAFQGNYPVPFDVYAYKSGYYPGKVTGLNFGAKGVKIVLKPLSPVHITSQWVDYYCSSNTYFGAPLPVGSVVEATTPGGLLVGQYYVTEAGQYGFMPVYRANDTLTDTLGAMTGDVITFSVNGDKAKATGDVTYPAAYTKVQVCLEAGATEPRNIELVPGWNLISFDIDPGESYLPAVLSSIGDCIDVVLGFEGGGLTYDPQLPQFSTLWSVDPYSGYWIKIKDGCSATLSLSGIPVPANTAIRVYNGWNLVSYLPTVSMAPVDALASLGNTLIVAYGFDGGTLTYKPGMGNFNTLEMMNPGFGYWVKVNMDGNLVYPGGVGAPIFVANNPKAEAARMAASVDVVPTTSWVNLYSSNLTLDGQKVQAGAKITALSENGTTVGSFVVRENGQFGFMPVYAATAAGEAGALKRGDSFRLAVNGTESNETFTWTDNGARIEVGSLTSKSGSDGNLPSSYSLSQNYPNPFNPTTTIKFSLPASGQARLEVFNVLGVRVATPFDGMATAGDNTVVWDGKNTKGESVASGVYFYRLTSGSFNETRKMVLLK
jgi:hypothetical protein